MTITDKNGEKVFHPSLDIKDGILVLGFRIKKDKGDESDLFIIKTDSKEGITTTEDYFFPYKDQQFAIDKKKRLLPKLSQKWSVELLNQFLDDSREGKLGENSSVLYTKIQDTLRKYIELERVEDYTLLSAWIIGTYFFPAFSAYPYIHIKAPKGSGKSQSLSFLNQTALNAVKARASLPALRDTVDSLRGVYLMDQADALHRNNMEDFLDVLTDSYKKAGGSVRKMVQTKNNWNLEEFEAYGPKAFASINQLPEDLRDRCIVVPLIRSKRNLPTLDEESGVWKELRDGLYKNLINNFSTITGNYLALGYGYKQSNEIFGRRLELWLPIEVVLRTSEVSENDIDEAKKRFLSRYEFASYQTSEIEVAVIETIMKLMKEQSELILRPKDIASEIDSEMFEDDDKFVFASTKQKSTIIGRAITKFNLASQKLPRDSYGEKYLFQKEHLQKIYEGYFSQQSKENDTPTYTDENIPLNITLSSVSTNAS